MLSSKKDKNNSNSNSDTNNVHQSMILKNISDTVRELSGYQSSLPSAPQLSTTNNDVLFDINDDYINNPCNNEFNGNKLTSNNNSDCDWHKIDNKKYKCISDDEHNSGMISDSSQYSFCVINGN